MAALLKSYNGLLSHGPPFLSFSERFKLVLSIGRQMLSVGNISSVFVL